MILKDGQREEFEEAARPLMKYLGENFHPHIKVIVDYSSAEIMESSACIRTDDYVAD